MQGQRIGYVRVSSFDQNPERQLEGVQVARVFTDKASGKDTQRPELERLLAFVREGDTVVVHSMDRLARNLDDLRRIVQGLTQRGVRMEFVKEGLKFTGEDSPMANLMLSVMGAFAEFERALIRERQREGIVLAKQRGAYRGRKKSLNGTVAKLAMRQPFVLFKGLTFQKLCLPGAFRPGDHHNKMLRPGLCVVHASPQYL
ncbi:recombinase family protein [Klebsiella michiganensis]|nr:recombinase family protein [Klebsiella michiganensis]EHS87594.1 transposons resolvase [Klebsiella oxytoca 10-5245]EHS87604.1 transposons resolvase [Klebsiella oxytoca 10-5245]MBZ6556601.1 recombinase family protein [Klebsiella michiganensis]MCZ0066786.1 recombinase family protein [Klebsiella michiganensis]MCZ0081591.1 recombinase family protein [Klebsiella michiganensis]